MNTKTCIFFLLGALLYAQSGWATVPEVLKGGWIIDEAATTENFKKSPKWDESTADYLPVILERMSTVVCTFDEGSMTVSNGVKKDTLTVALTNAEERLYVFAGKSGDDEVTIRAALSEKGLLNIRTSTTDDMDYYLWKRVLEGFVPPQETVPPAALKLLKQSLNPPEKQPSS